MFYATFWALVLGFTISGAIQAFGSRASVAKQLGSHKPSAVAKASFFGAISSSCSYAASSAAKSLFNKGADFTTAMVFMFASTNLVIELGLVLWVLLSWQFALAEFIGGAIMIVLLTLLLPRFAPQPQIEQNLSMDSASAVRSSTWHDAAGFTIGDIKMIRYELVIGFLIAGLADRLVPLSWWHALFLQGHGFLATLENAFIAPIIACISFVCSVGNIPLGAGLWSAGISFGGTISFIFADLLSLPLILIYKKYYGVKLTYRLVAVFWFTMSVAGLLTEAIFKALGILPAHPTRMLMATMDSFGNNRTTWLNAIACLVAIGLIALYITRDKSDNSPVAIDPICGMQVNKADAIHTFEREGKTYYFCAPGCLESYANNPTLT